jgi:hypothetical protein
MQAPVPILLSLAQAVRTVQGEQHVSMICYVLLRNHEFLADVEAEIPKLLEKHPHCHSLEDLMNDTKASKEVAGQFTV